MSFGGGSATTVQTSEPYAPTTGALGQIVSEAGNIYAAGPQYVAPSDITLEGLGQQEALGRAANEQIAATIAGQYSNPFLSPIIAQAADEAYTNVASQFSGAGRTPGSPVSQQQVASQVAQKAIPYAFNAYEAERQRQLGTARAVPSLTAVGQTLEDYEAARQAAPYQALQQYSNIINPVARGGVTQMTQAPTPNRLGTAAGGALAGAALGSQIGGSIGGYSSTAIGGVLGALGGLL
jgi:hypothetical protein